MRLPGSHSSMPPLRCHVSPTGLLLVAPSALPALALEQLGQEDGAALARHNLPRQHPGKDLDLALITGPKPHRTDMEHLGSALGQVIPIADEDDVTVAIRVDRLFWHHDG